MYGDTYTHVDAHTIANTHAHMHTQTDMFGVHTDTTHTCLLLHPQSFPH